MKVLHRMAVSLISLSVLLPLPTIYAQGQTASSIPFTNGLPLIGSPPRQPHRPNPRLVEADNKSNAAVSRGEMFLNAGNIVGSIEAFQEALKYVPTNGLAYQRLAEAYTAAGQLDMAVDAYRKVVYDQFGPGVGNGIGNNVPVFMQFALVLLRTNHDDEALAVYHRTAHLLNYQDSENHNGKPYLSVLLPEFGDGPDQVAYTPQRLAAMAHVAIGYETFGFEDKQPTEHLREAVRLYPDSPVAQFYLAEDLVGRAGHAREAREAYHAAAQLGGPEVKAQVEKTMRGHYVDSAAHAEQNLEDGLKAQAAQKAKAEQKANAAPK